MVGSFQQKKKKKKGQGGTWLRVVLDPRSSELRVLSGNQVRVRGGGSTQEIRGTLEQISARVAEPSTCGSALHSPKLICGMAGWGVGSQWWLL